MEKNLLVIEDTYHVINIILSSNYMNLKDRRICLVKYYYTQYKTYRYINIYSLYDCVVM